MADFIGIVEVLAVYKGQQSILSDMAFGVTVDAPSESMLQVLTRHGFSDVLCCSRVSILETESLDMHAVRRA